MHKFEECKKIFAEKLKKYAQTSERNFYHYTGSCGFKSILHSKHIWFSNIEFLNDEEELYYTYRLVIEVAEEIKASLNKDFYNIIINIYEKYLKVKERPHYCSDYYVASFSEDKDNLNLWNYYTKSPNSVGYNICFNIGDILDRQKEKLKDILDTSRIISGKVIYNQELQKSIIKGTMIDFNNIYQKEKDEKVAKLISLYYWYSVNDCSLFFKHPAFEQEHEFRIVLPRGRLAKNEDFVKIREVGLFFIPYIEVEFEPEDVLSVTCSPTVENLLVQKGVKTLLKICGYSDTVIEKSNIPLRY